MDGDKSEEDRPKLYQNPGAGSLRHGPPDAEDRVSTPLREKGTTRGTRDRSAGGSRGVRVVRDRSAIVAYTNDATSESVSLLVMLADTANQSLSQKLRSLRAASSSPG